MFAIFVTVPKGAPYVVADCGQKQRKTMGEGVWVVMGGRCAVLSLSDGCGCPRWMRWYFPVPVMMQGCQYGKSRF